MTYAPMTVRWVAVACFLLVAANFIALWNDTPLANVPAQLHAQEPMPAAAAGVPRVLGGNSCFSCHEKPIKQYVDDGVTLFIKMTETKTWQDEDKHSRAFDLIDPSKSERSKQICDKMGIAEIREAKQCLSCHSNWQYDGDKSEWLAPPKKLENGVSCEACHGPASEWYVPHQDADWRKLSPKAKDNMGFRDVRNPAVQATQCASCHVGDAKQQRLVTHEMYAAGHPPLPSFELQTFIAAMPAHWRTKDPTKPEFKFHKEFVDANPAIKDGGEFPASRAVLLGGVETMRSSLLLVSGMAQQKEKLPDFALFDCYACHHNLKATAAAPRKEARVPGRPHPHVWPNALVSAALAYANVPAESYQKALADYHAAFDAQPFGKPDSIATSRKHLEKELDTIAEAVQNTKADRAAVSRAWIALISPSTKATLDYDSARQIAWAMHVFSRELDVLIPEGFAEKLHLTLPGGQKQLLLDDLPLRLKALSEFDAEAFHGELKRLPDRK